MTTPQQISRLLIFTEVARTGSFTQAARSLKMTKSAVSQNISRLEAELNSRLLNRTTRGIALTALGERLAQQTQLLADQANRISQTIDADLESPSGTMSITYPHALEADLVVPAVRQLGIEFPKLRFHLSPDDAPLDLVAHKLDVAIHVGRLADSSYRALSLGSIQEWFCSTAQTANELGSELTLDRLLAHRWITTPWQDRQFRLLNINTQQERIIKPNPYMHLQAFSGILPLVTSSVGFALLPDVIAQPYLKQKQLVRLIPEWRGPTWPVYFVHAYQSKRPAHIHRFYELIQSHFDQKGF